jgi:hypothetical protein
MVSDSRRPVVLVDDLNTPMPVSRVLPTSWTFWADGGAGQATVLAVGSHAPLPRPAWIASSARCRPVVGSWSTTWEASGRGRTTSFGTHDREPVGGRGRSLVGVGGIHPHSSASSRRWIQDRARAPSVRRLWTHLPPPTAAAPASVAGPGRPGDNATATASAPATTDGVTSREDHELRLAHWAWCWGSGRPSAGARSWRG